MSEVSGFTHVSEVSDVVELRVSIPDELHKALKVKAARDGKTLKETVIEALTREVEAPSAKPAAATAADAAKAAAAAAATIASTDQLLGELKQLKRRWLQVFTSWLKKNPKALSRELLRDFERALEMFVELGDMSPEEHDRLVRELVEAGVPLPSYTAVHQGEAEEAKPHEEKPKAAKRVTIRDVIAKRKVQLLSEVKPRDAQQFIKSAKEQGIIVLEGERDVLLADPDFYHAFFEKLPSLPLEPKFEDEAEEKLFKFLVENGLIYRDAEKGWQPVR